jgi:hypothetical protein
MKEVGEHVGAKIAKKLDKKAVKAVIKKLPIVGIVFFGADLVQGGAIYALNELVWPVSKFWGGGG